MDFFPDPWLGHDFGRQWVLTADVPEADDSVKWQYIPYVLATSVIQVAKSSLDILSMISVLTGMSCRLRNGQKQHGSSPNSQRVRCVLTVSYIESSSYPIIDAHMAHPNFSWNKTYFELASKEPVLDGLTFRGAYKLDHGFLQVYLFDCIDR